MRLIDGFNLTTVFKYLSLSLISILLFGAVPARSQNVVPNSRLSCSIDYSRFQFSNDEGYVEIYYAVYPSSVTFNKENDTLQGAVVFRIAMKNTKNDSLVIKSSISLSIKTVDTSAAFMKNAYLGITKHVVPNGIYELSIYAHDALNPSRKDSLRKSFSVERSDNNISISDVSLCSKLVMSQDKANPFYKNSYEVEVNPSLLFGSNFKPVVFSYAEIYNLKIDSFYLITVQVVDAKNGIQQQNTRMKQYSVRNAVDAAKLNIFSIPSGKYKYQLILSDTLGKEITRTEKPVFIYNPQLEQTASVKMSAKSIDLAGLTEEELAEEFNKARYIANYNDSKTFEKLTTIESRRDFLANFWVNIENEQRGTTNLTRREYLDRVKIANERYSSMGKDGWKTDRGRVYIIYSKPDEIERFPYSDNTKPYEIWSYHQIEGGVVFVFIDRYSIGEYILVHSTKRGELQDESWQQYLQ